MAARRRYTKTEKAEAVAAATLTSTEAAAESRGIPRKTLAYWMDQPEFASLRHETRENVADQFWAVIQLGLGRIAELIPHTDDLQKVSVATGIIYDKHALLTGGATGRTESRDLSDLPDSTYIDAVRAAKRLTESADPDPALAEDREGSGLHRLPE